MLDFQQKKKVRKVLYSRITIFLLLVVVIFLARATYNIYSKEKISGQDYATVLKNFNDLKQRSATLSLDINNLSTENGQEEEIRDKYSVAKPGETVVVVLNSTSGTSTVSDGSNKSLWQKFLDLFR